ncbi:hypothetical protein H310_07977 [Aphanomyces invadans]|uniref:EF-hand domain-containing protein n=1 Tax=Aphanomyces invadans TaxID=157072 RepID=A0A024TYT9_9STRA|nr:hypothetical protein H310_07977 [Aphanomyces invadans]ETV99183.1 hypothetical protein H310_07977 [Aphanomyces invadans]|eukprot:XP_008871739.1 hypothetical protein H310_07977 [Aphanomyces invadans]
MLPLPALHLVDWLWCRLPVSLEQMPLDHLAMAVPPTSDLPHVCFAARVVQSADPWFDCQAAKFGTKVCYHGSRMASFHSILQNGLHVMSGTRHMSSGNLFGDGIYFAESIHVAANFASPAASAWAKSAILTKAATCLVVCEVICDPSRMKLLPSAKEDGAYYVVQDERCVRITKETLALGKTAIPSGMNNALLVYKPRKRLRKKPNTEKLEPLVAKQLVQKWQNDAAKCFVEADLFLRWRNSTHDDRQAALQATWAVVFSHTSEKYHVQQPPEHYSSTEPLPSCSISSLSSPCCDVTKSKNWCDQGAHELAQDCTGPPRASVNRKVTWVLRLRKAPPAEVMPQMTVSKPLVAIPPLTSSLESDAVEPAMGWKQRSRFSIEMRRKLEAHLMQKMAGNLWHDEVRSILARPLDATVFVNRVEQLDHGNTSQRFVGLECRGPRLEGLYPYSNHAHGCARMIYRCYKKSCDRQRMQSHLRQLVVATRLLQDFFRFRVHCLVKRRRVRAVQSIVARRLQSQMRSYLKVKQSSARQIQCRWRQAQANKVLMHRRRVHRAATTIHRVGKQFVWNQRRRNVLAVRIQRFGRAWLWRRWRRRAEASRREAEMDRIKASSKAATAECMAFLMTAQGKVDLKRELRRMKENEKLAKKQMHVAARSVVKKDDLETMAIRHSFEAFDTDGSGSIELDELRLLLSELGIPISERELIAGFQEMDTDGSGAIDFDEFAAWWKTGLTAGKAKTQMILLRLKLRGQSMVKRITGAEARAQAAKHIVNRRRFEAMMAARDAFRKAYPPVIHCHMCQAPFGLERDWFLHTRHHCNGRDELQQSSTH